MSTHPNAMLLLVLTPDNATRKTFRAIAEEANAPIEEGSFRLKIGSSEYTANVMEDDYDQDGYQISAPEGSIVVHDFITYGYGEKIAWEQLLDQKAELQAWADEICAKHACKAEFFVTANYW